MKKSLFLAMFAAAFMAAPAAEHSTATLRAEYKYEYAIPQSDSIRHRSDVMVLQIAPDESRFYSIKTEFYDSIVASPGGRQMIEQLRMDALNNSGGIKRDGNGNITSITVSPEAFKNIPSKGVMANIYKYPLKGNMAVTDGIPGPGDAYYSYDVAMDDLAWEPGDSTATILGHECQNAVADYHGRRWTAWFAPDIPVSEDPWQLYGLPGLILMAESDGGEYLFTATGVHESDEPIKDIAGNHDAERTTRKEFLRLLNDHTVHPGKAFGIVGNEPPVYHDLIETDYK